MKKLENKVALVTGAAGAGAGGTGRSIAERLAAEGAKLVIVDLNAENGSMTAREMREQGYDVLFLPCDISQADQVEATIAAAIEHYGRLDILVNNAYLYDAAQVKLADIAIEDWDNQFAVNIRGHFLFCKFAIPHLIKNESSVIVNISSCSAISPEDKGTAYGACKAALNTMSGYIAVQYGRDGLRCNTVMPGLILSDTMDAALKDDPGLAAFFGVYDRNILLNRHGNGRDVANLVAFLATDQSAYITGQSFVVDGGMAAHSTELSDMRALVENS